MLLLMDQARRLRRHARMLRATSERVRAASSKTRKKLSASRLPLYWPSDSTGITPGPFSHQLDIGFRQQLSGLGEQLFGLFYQKPGLNRQLLCPFQEVPGFFFVCNGI